MEFLSLDGLCTRRTPCCLCWWQRGWGSSLWAKSLPEYYPSKRRQTRRREGIWRGSGLRGQRAMSLAQQLLAFLVQTYHRLARIVGTSIQIQQLVHAPAVLCGELANAPHQFAPGFEEVFFRIRRMLS